MGFAMRFGAGRWKLVVLFALVRGVLHCFKLEIIIQCVASRLGNQLLHRQKQNKHSPGESRYPGYNKSGVYFPSDLLKKNCIHGAFGIDDLVDNSFFLLPIREALRISTATHSVAFKNCMSRS